MKKRKKKFSKKNFLNRKGISGVVAAVIMIALVMAVGVIVWVVVRNTVQGQLGNVKSCFGSYDKVTLNNRYTCYDSANSAFQFSVSIGDIDVDKVRIAISSLGSINSYDLSSTDNTDLESYPTAGGEVIIPGKNSGKTYVLENVNEKPDLVEIAPIIDGQQCEVSDSISEIDYCFDLA